MKSAGSQSAYPQKVSMLSNMTREGIDTAFSKPEKLLVVSRFHRNEYGAILERVIQFS